jgi:hypothetical protein
MGRGDVVLATAKRRPNPCQEVVQMRGNKTRTLRECGVGTVNDEGHEEQRERKVFRVEGDDEEGDLARGVVLREGVCVGEREGGKEGVRVENAACE